ncbi:MAG: DUF523 domain-containing protein [Spirochaetales bacterium]|nr:DUF523 domain-containing protein [Spirochaetales bacterium]
MSKLILVSACLAGISCRYDGGETLDEEIVRLVREGKAVPLCPEVLGGLPTPRVPCEITGEKDGRFVVVDREGVDRSEAFEKGARIALDFCRSAGIERAVLKSGSPSCGCRSVYDGTFSGRKIPGRGVTADLLMRHGIDVVSEEMGER